jgi:hypothetical protein
MAEAAMSNGKVLANCYEMPGCDFFQLPSIICLQLDEAFLNGVHNFL